MVVLPDPDGPMIATHSPSRTCMLILSSGVTAPYLLVKPFVSRTIFFTSSLLTRTHRKHVFAMFCNACAQGANNHSSFSTWAGTIRTAILTGKAAAKREAHSEGTSVMGTTARRNEMNDPKTA
jgi:hypothetical protein